MTHQCPKTLGKHGCADCLRNRVYDKRVLTHRLHLESLNHASSVFITLTYDDAHLPPGGTLVRSDYVNFLKRFRAYIAPRQIRYYFVGEYGDTSERPHYHAILFGVSPKDEDALRSAWPLGHIMLGEVNIKTIRYTAGYIQKKLINKDQDWLNGRIPEFGKGSTKPGLGRAFVDNIMQSLDNDAGRRLLLDDVPSSLQLSGRPMPLGRYMQNKLREAAYGKQNPIQKLIDDAVLLPSKKQAQHEKKMLDVQKDYERSSMSKKMTRVKFQQVNQQAKNKDQEAQFIINQQLKDKI